MLNICYLVLGDGEVQLSTDFGRAILNKINSRGLVSEQ